MQFPWSYLQDRLILGNIFYFKSDRLSSELPHHYICIATKPDGVYGMMCCTSQFEKCRDYLHYMNLPNSTLVKISISEDNELTKETFVNCNSNYHEFSLDQLVDLHNEFGLQFTGKVLLSELLQIKTGIIDSPVWEENKKQFFRDLDI